MLSGRGDRPTGDASEGDGTMTTLTIRPMKLDGGRPGWGLARDGKRVARGRHLGQVIAAAEHLARTLARGLAPGDRVDLVRGYKVDGPVADTWDAARVAEEDARVAWEAERYALAEAERCYAARYREEHADRVRAGRGEGPEEASYVPIPASDVPRRVRFDTPGYLQGQIVETSFGTFGRAEAGDGDPYMRVIDHSGGPVRYYRRRDT
jgi:hypothetical protein